MSLVYPPLSLLVLGGVVGYVRGWKFRFPMHCSVPAAVRWNSDEHNTQEIRTRSAVSAETGQLGQPGWENVEVNSRAGSLMLISREDKGLPHGGRELLCNWSNSW